MYAITYCCLWYLLLAPKSSINCQKTYSEYGQHNFSIIIIQFMLLFWKKNNIKYHCKISCMLIGKMLIDYWTLYQLQCDNNKKYLAIYNWLKHNWLKYNWLKTWGLFLYRDVRILIIKISWSHYHLIFIMGILCLVRLSSYWNILRPLHYKEQNVKLFEWLSKESSKMSYEIYLLPNTSDYFFFLIVTQEKLSKMTCNKRCWRN